MGKAEIDMVRLEEPAYDADCWGAMSVVVEDIKANGQEAYVPSCACEYKDMALNKNCKSRLGCRKSRSSCIYKSLFIAYR